MKESNKEEIAGAETAGEEKIAPPAARASSRRPMYVAFSIIGAIVAGVLLFLIFRGGAGGDAVPAPRSVTFDSAGEQENAALTGEQTVAIEPEQIERIGLKIETAGETMSGEAAQAAATGVVQANAYAETPVISLVGGVVRRIDAELGENVSRGQAVAVVFSDELAAAQSRYIALQTEAQTARQSYERASQLVAINPASRAEQDAAQAALKADEAELDEMRRRYERTVKLVEIGASSREELEQDRTKLRTAEAELERSRRQSRRASEVARINPISRGEFEQAAVRLRTAESEMAAARQRLLLLGLPEQRISALRSPAQISAELPVTAPISGTVTSRSANRGEIVEANKELLKITNLSTVWVVAQVYEKDLGAMRVGSGASVTTDAYPGRLFRGQVTYVDPQINSETRTAQARVELENPNQILKIGMYVNVTFGALGTGEMTAPVIPAAAVQNIGNRTAVFVPTEKPGVFVLKPVRLGAETEGRFVVLEGLNVGDRIVTQGSFLLRAELLKQSPNQ